MQLLTRPSRACRSVSKYRTLQPNPKNTHLLHKLATLPHSKVHQQARVAHLDGARRCFCAVQPYGCIMRTVAPPSDTKGMLSACMARGTQGRRRQNDTVLGLAGDVVSLQGGAQDSRASRTVLCSNMAEFRCSRPVHERAQCKNFAEWANGTSLEGRGGTAITDNSMTLQATAAQGALQPEPSAG